MLDRLKENLHHVQQRIADAAKKSGRAPDEITLVGVTKYVDAEVTRTFVEAGCKVLGESRPQKLWEKADALSDLDIQWHLIGHLQRNKVKQSLGYVSLIHSIDSLRLLNAVEKAARQQGVIAQVLLEVNVSGEDAKHGFSLAQEGNAIKEVLPSIAEMKSVKVEGLMAMAGLNGGLDDARHEFGQLRELRDQLVAHGLPSNVALNELSMGMSNDYEIAIEEGATIVRVGSALFDGVR